jgi:hypothetical protein
MNRCTAPTPPDRGRGVLPNNCRGMLRVSRSTRCPRGSRKAFRFYSSWEVWGSCSSCGGPPPVIRVAAGGADSPPRLAALGGPVARRGARHPGGHRRALSRATPAGTPAPECPRRAACPASRPRWRPGVHDCSALPARLERLNRVDREVAMAAVRVRARCWSRCSASSLADQPSPGSDFGLGSPEESSRGLRDAGRAVLPHVRGARLIRPSIAPG